MKYLYSFFLIICCLSTSFAQNGLQQIGARTAAVGYTAATIADRWALFNNPGGIGSLNELGAVFGFENKYNIEGLRVMAVGAVIPVPFGTSGLSVFRFGDDLYNEQTASFTFGNKFGIASLGFRANYLQYQIEGFGNKGIFTLDFGGIADITEQLSFGAYIRNINQAQISELADERAPTMLNAGISYQPTDKILLNIEAEKDIDYEASLRAGLEYRFLKKLAARAGVRTKPFTHYFGMGLSLKKLVIDYALTIDPLIGMSHQAGLAYVLKQKK